MALNAKKIKSANTSSSSRVEQPHMEAGTYPCRVVQVIDLGLQPQRAWKGEEKPPAHTIQITYEFTDEFCVDKDGNEDETKPRWLSEDMPIHSLTAELAKSTKRYNAIDPQGIHDGDFGALVGMPCNVTITATAGKGTYEGRVFNNVASVSSMRPRDAERTNDLVNEGKVFDTSEPDVEVFRSLPEFLQEKIKSNLEYRGSALEAALTGGSVKPTVDDEPEDEDDNNDDAPW